MHGFRLFSIAGTAVHLALEGRAKDHRFPKDWCTFAPRMIQSQKDGGNLAITYFGFRHDALISMVFKPSSPLQKVRLRDNLALGIENVFVAHQFPLFSRM